MDSPTELGSEDVKTVLKRTQQEIKEDRVPLVAAGMAYYLFLAIFPAFIALLGILNLVSASEATISGIGDWLGRNLPGGSGAVLVEAVEAAKNPTEGASLVAALLGIGIALWSASSGFVALQAGLNIAYDIPRDRTFLRKRAVALLLIVATGLLGAVPSPIFAFGDGPLASIAGWALTIVAVITLFSIYYAIGPKRDAPRWRWVSPGGLVGAFVWIAASLGFGFYASAFADYSKTYGPVGLVVVLILWLYLSSLSILIGGEVNSEMERRATAKA